MLTLGAQIKAAGAFLGMCRNDLAAVAGVQPNAAKCWEDRRVPSGPLPYAVERIAKALCDRGVEVFADPKPGVRLVARGQFPTQYAREAIMSDKRKITSPLNAKRSTGPRTAEGKAASRLNGLRHGLYSEVTIVAGESEAELVAFGKRLRADLAPVGEVELVLADRIVSLAWRLRRLISIEGEIIEEGVRSSSYDRSPGRAFGGSSGDKLVRLSTYEAKLDRQLFKAMHELQRLQAARRGEDVPLDVVDVTLSSDHVEDQEQQAIEVVAVASVFENGASEFKQSNGHAYPLERP